MSPLENARQLSGGISAQCDFCTGSPISGHFGGCPVLAMPRIVAALEAVYGLMMTEDGAEPIEGSGTPDDPFVWAHCQRPAGGPHWDGCLWVKLADLVYRARP